jgi:beta-lactamase class A
LYGRLERAKPCARINKLGFDTTLTTDTKSLQKIVDLAIRNICNDFAIGNDDLAVSLVDLTDRKQMRWAGHRENEPIYPASIAKLFFAVYAYRWLEQGKIARTAELERAMRDMIAKSSNDASSYVIDLMTDTTSGPELSDSEMKVWMDKRAVINTYFAERGYKNFNLNQKPVADGRYGRERVCVEKSEMNKVTAKATAELLIEILEEKAALPHQCKELLFFMERDLNIPSDDPDSQTHAFIGNILPPGAKYWSKAGWTDDVRHDAAYVELPNGKKLCLVIFTCNHSEVLELVPAIGAEIITALELL